MADPTIPSLIGQPMADYGFANNIVVHSAAEFKRFL